MTCALMGIATAVLVEGHILVDVCKYRCPEGIWKHYFYNVRVPYRSGCHPV